MIRGGWLYSGGCKSFSAASSYRLVLLSLLYSILIIKDFYKPLYPRKPNIADLVLGSQLGKIIGLKNPPIDIIMNCLRLYATDHRRHACL